MSGTTDGDLARECIDTLRLLAVDMVEAARSGHPGLPLGAAHAAHAIFTGQMRHAPHDPSWPDRDRFVLSAGHGSALLYSLLHLTGYDLPLEELKRFRQWGSKTPGHPEVHLTPGVETTTGPLGQGFANGVGMAMAERFLAERFNRDGHEIVSHRVFGIVSDGDLMEGIASEAASLAGTLGLGRLVYVYDDNDISIDGSTDITFREDVPARFEAYGWHVQSVGGHDLAAMDAALDAAVAETSRPSLIVAATHIGLDSPVQDTAEAHGSPLGPDNVRALREKLGRDPDAAFVLPDRAVAEYRKAVGRGEELVADWKRRLEVYRDAHSDAAAELDRILAGRLPDAWTEDLPAWEPGSSLATRQASGKVLQVLAQRVPELVGGSADLAASNKTYIAGGGDLGHDSGGRNVHFGVREHAMGGIANGMALHGGVRPYAATFLVFSDYMRPAIRLAALSGIPVVYVFTHDSIGLGEDGPTHQPVEHLAALRAIPNLTVLRPADANETREAWVEALSRTDGPVLLALTRQGVPTLERPLGADARRGASVVREARAGRPDVLLLASGSEVHLAVEAAERLEADGGPAARVVSVSSWELFDAQPEEYRRAVLPAAVHARVAVEAGIRQGWERFLGDGGRFVGLDRFGASAPYEDLYRELGITVEAVVAQARAAIDDAAG